jgi:hypothetical protein
MRWENYGSETALARIGDIFGVKEQTEFAEDFFGENP